MPKMNPWTCTENFHNTGLIGSYVLVLVDIVATCQGSNRL